MPAPTSPFDTASDSSADDGYGLVRPQLSAYPMWDGVASQPQAGWYVPEYAATTIMPQTFAARLGLGGKRLPLFLILCLMALGLVVAITPALARSHLGNSTKRVSLALSGYGMVGDQGPTDQVPVVDATSRRPEVISAREIAESQERKPGDVTGPPSISVDQIEAVLKKYGSPAVGKGQTLYDLGVKYNINPAYALAFFVHESGCGTKGVARFTNSLGNIRTTPGYADYQGYRSYPTWESGMEDWYKLISELYVGEWGLRTVDAIIPVYAPWGDNNNPPAYISSVKSMVDSWRGK